MSSRGGRGHSKRSRPREDGWEGQGGYMNAKRQKLKEQFDKEAPQQLKNEGSGSQIFQGVTIHVNGYTKPSSDKLKRLMMLHGGAYEHYLFRTRVSHVIATNLPDSKVRELKGLKVVKPEWITESIAAGKLLSYSSYLLYTAQSGLQTGLQTFSVNKSRDQSSNVTTTTAKHSQQSNDVTMLNETSSLSSSDFTQSVQATNSSSRITVNTQPRYPHSLSDKENVTGNNSALNEGSISHLPEKRNEQCLTNNHSSVSVSNRTSPAKAGDVNFLNEYYSNSRLHFLSTWKAEFKSYVNELQKQATSYPGRERLRKVVQERDVGISDNTGYHGRIGKPKRCIMHVDMDCFFVSVGLINRPDLKGKPVAVTHSKGKGAAPEPGSDLHFEKQQWELKRLTGGKKGRKPVHNNPNPNNSGEDFSFPDKSDSESDDDDTTNVTTATSETFHSMAEIASCSYEARQRGVKNGMFMGKAKAVCPELLTIPYDFEQYKAVSKILYDTVASYSHDIEAVSCDEMMVDCTELLADTGATPSEFAMILREEIFSKTGCCASAGLASNILLAKMSTRKAKPNGQFHLPDDKVNEFMKPQSIKDIPGVGWSLTKRFETMKVLTCGDLQRISLDMLQKEFGPKTGQSLYRYCRGEDDRPVKMEQQRKSVSAEVNYGIRFNNDMEAHKFIQELSEEVCSRLHSLQMKGKTITLKLMIRRVDAPKATSKFMGHGICNNFSKSTTLPMPTDDPKIVGQECLSILKQQRCMASDLRGIGIQIQRLEPSVVGNLGKLPKNQSILNFIVDKNQLNDSNQDISDNKSGNVTITAATGTQLRQNPMRENTSPSKNTLPISGSTNQTRVVTPGSHAIDRNSPKDSRHVEGLVSDSSILIKDVNNTAVEVSLSERDMDEIQVADSSLSRSLIVADVSVESSNLLKDLGQRQVISSHLPPLPCLPDLKSPVIQRTSFKDVTTPKSGSSRSDDNGNREMIHDDYFPSPSQIDPEVLKELPPEIRLQVEKEIESRKKSSNTTKNARSGQGQSCPTRQQSKGVHSDSYVQSKGQSDPLPSLSQIDPDVLKELPPEIRLQVEKDIESRKKTSIITKNASEGEGQSFSTWQQLKGVHSHHSDDNRHSTGNNSQTHGNHIMDDIVPLPSSSQLDMSCLNALPESLQKEIRQAYAMQDQNNSVNNSTTSMMRLQQAKSPSKSPNKRSPGKRSPQFKVPRGRATVKGRKKNSSKKLVFKDQQKQNLLVEQKYTNHDTVVEPGSSYMPDIDTDCNSQAGEDNHLQAKDTHISESESELNGGQADIDTVNLCGAVKIVEVRSLIREWVSSTPDPQAEDEEVFLEYIHGLIQDKNLEQVDLVLKAMYRNINRTENMDWLSALQRIFQQTQSIVKEYYGHRLSSISI